LEGLPDRGLFPGVGREYLYESFFEIRTDIKMKGRDVKIKEEKLKE